MRIRSVLFGFAVMGMLLGCRSPESAYTVRKMDARLRSVIDEKKLKDVHFTGHCTEAISAELRARLQETGIDVQTVVGDRFTAIGSPRQIRKLVRLDFIIRLTAAKPVHPTVKQE